MFFSKPFSSPARLTPLTGEAMDFEFGQNIHRVHPNKSPLKILEKREHGHKGVQACPGTAQFFGVPPNYIRNR